MTPNVVSLRLSKQLYELSKWSDTYFWHAKLSTGEYKMVPIYFINPKIE
jgi:hypothetical protein